HEATRRVPEDVRSGPRGADHSADCGRENVAMPDVVLGARPVAGRQRLRHERSRSPLRGEELGRELAEIARVDPQRARLGSRPVREEFVAHELDIMRKLHAARVPFLAGTDTPAGVDVLPGISLHLELQRFVAAGFTPLEALQTATLNPADFYNRRSDYGTVEIGRIADLVLLRANPLENIANTRTVTGVVTDG